MAWGCHFSVTLDATEIEPHGGQESLHDKLLLFLLKWLCVCIQYYNCSTKSKGTLTDGVNRNMILLQCSLPTVVRLLLPTTKRCCCRLKHQTALAMIIRLHSTKPHIQFLWSKRIYSDQYLIMV